MPTAPESPFDKDDLRDELLVRRDALDRAFVTDASSRLADQLEGIEGLVGAEGLAAYAAIRNEIEPRGFVARRLSSGTRVYFPRVVGPGQMEFVRVEDFEALVPGTFGVPEPAEGPAASLELIDAFLVPGVAFDTRGGRVGFGGGFYDRLLRGRRALEDAGAARALFVGVGYGWQLHDEPVPVEHHDIMMDLIATPDGVTDPSAAAPYVSET